MRRVATVGLVLLFGVPASQAMAQAPAEPKIWTVTASAGIAFTSGNTDTSTVNAAYDLVYDPQRRNVVKSDFLAIRGKTEGELTADRLSLNARDEYKLTDRLVVFGQNQYLRDTFKDIDYLLAPGGGLGYKILDTAATKFTVDGGLGSVWEKNPGFDVDVSGALTAGEKFVRALTTTATLTETFSSLWKTSDFNDALYTFQVSLAAAMSTRTQLKFEVVDTFKNQPPTALIQKNDVALLMSIVYKI
ncbi:MAG TPA: DUF481 domain-containing protein [Vicinamibacterales bacterium]|jgi:putative salt-induced outer membrane protein YdiY|nr:DUF481 domain-containing protein [Vicinamibacterales bacterium]